MPSYNPTMPTVDPVAHMRVALSYIEEVGQAKLVTTDNAASLLGKLSTAAQHVNKAREQDPSLHITAHAKNGDPFEQTQDDLSARILALEGWVASLAASNWTGDDGTGREYLTQARGAYESALRYRPNDADYHFSLAKVFKLLGDKENSLREAHEALRCNSSHVEAIKFIDVSGGEWEPLWQDKAPLKAPMSIPWKSILFGGAVLVLFIGSQLSGSASKIGSVMALIAFGMIAAGFIKWKFERDVEKSYRSYESARLDKSIRDTTREIHANRYDREEEGRRKKR